MTRTAHPDAPVIETFRKKRVFTDGEMTVELHDIGPTSHVNEIVLAYFPMERPVFQGDLIIIAPRGAPAPANALTAEFAQALERLHLDVETIAGVHGRVGTIGDLRRRSRSDAPDPFPARGRSDVPPAFRSSPWCRSGRAAYRAMRRCNILQAYRQQASSDPRTVRASAMVGDKEQVVCGDA